MHAAAAVAAAIVAGTSGCQSLIGSRTRLTEVPPLVPYTNRSAADALPHPQHVIIVMEENKSDATIIGNVNAPYINHLAAIGASFSHATGVAHPSQPNYLALFTGQTNSDADDCPEQSLPASTPSLGGSLARSGLTFAGYAEGLPHAGFTGCSSGDADTGYARKHAPWVNFQDVPPAESVPMTTMPIPSRLPTVSFIIPDLGNDMHSGSIAAADRWLHLHVNPLVVWSLSHDSVVIIAWDESDTYYGNSVPLVIVGARVRAGKYTEAVDHYRILRTIEDMYGLPYLGASANVAPIDDVWQAR